MTEGKQALLAQVLREAGRPVDVTALLARLRRIPAPDASRYEPPHQANASLPLLQYRVTYEYAEFVRGESRRFLHQTVVEADGLEGAHAAAIAHFDQLEGHSGVGWRRMLVRCLVTQVETPRLPS